MYLWFEITFLYSIGDDDEEEEEGGEEGEEGEEKMPTCGDYIMHFLTLFWKVIFATIPPAGKQSISITANFYLNKKNYVYLSRFTENSFR